MHLFRVSRYCRHKILQHNPRHAIRRWENLLEALEDPEFLLILRSIQRRYPQEKAEQLLATLGVERGREREAYYDDEEYAAALLGTSPEELERLYGPPP
jgi:hypothetical protein